MCVCVCTKVCIQSKIHWISPEMRHPKPKYSFSCNLMILMLQQLLMTGFHEQSIYIVNWKSLELFCHRNETRILRTVLLRNTLWFHQHFDILSIPQPCSQGRKHIYSNSNCCYITENFFFCIKYVILRGLWNSYLHN